MARRILKPIQQIEIYKNDVVVKRAGGRIDRDKERGEICTFTQRARKRLAFIAANTDIEFRVMLTLTYPRVFPSDGLKVKRDISAILKRIKRKLGGWDYLWFLEFQRRGAPHVHILTDRLYIDRLWLSEAWWEVVGSDDRDHLLAGTNIIKLEKTGGWYAVKYAMKPYQKTVPDGYRNVGRFYGYSRDVKPKLYMTVDSGDVGEIFGDKYIDVVEKGYSTIFGASGEVASNVVRRCIDDRKE